MSLKSDIKKIFKDNADYGNPGLAVNQASSLDTLSVDLYTDSKRFIYELLQNADDSPVEQKAIQVWIKLFDDYLIVAHSGKPFSARDVQGLCNVNNGTKKLDQTKTGYKGIGFKSVFGQSENVTIFTDNEYFRFDSSFKFKWTWPDTKETWENNNDRKFQFPWQIIPIYTEAHEVPDWIDKFIKSTGAKVATIIKLNSPEETRSAIQNLSGNLNMFLFLKNISKIDFDISKPISTVIDRGKKNQITIRQNGIASVSWLLNNISLVVPKSLKSSLQGDKNIPEKLLNSDRIELSLAAKLTTDGIARLNAEERLLYAYLPTDETRYSFPVLANTSFLTVANREGLHTDSKWNQWLFKNIAIEIFKWISELVRSEFQYQAYRLIPNKTVHDALGIEFNKGIDQAVNDISFIITQNKKLATIADTIVDFTFLSDKEFVGKNPIKEYVITKGNASPEQFAANTGFGTDFKGLGAASFEWKDFSSFISSKNFKTRLTISSNIALINHLKDICESGRVPEISVASLKNIQFVWDHRNEIKSPTQVCFPAPDDQNWNNPGSDLSFVHPELQKWLLTEPNTKEWLHTLGVVEKTDLTYITQTILPTIESYVTLENALKTIQELFHLYRKGDLKEDLINKLSRIKLLTQKGSLRPALECYMANIYSPRLQLETVLDGDIFISQSYCIKVSDKDEWKRFFRMLGGKECITVITYPKTMYSHVFINEGFVSKYFEFEDKKFQPAYSIFTVDSYRNINSLWYLESTFNNPKFATKFWLDFIENNDPHEVNLPATGFWGREDWPGRSSGNEIKNYVPWVILNQESLPVVTGECKRSGSILLNTKEIISLAGNYLPVFDGPELSPDWKAFFGFRTRLELQDYLDLLSKISLDLDEKERVKAENARRIQLVYAKMLDESSNWSLRDISLVEGWSRNATLVNSKHQISKCVNLKYFIDGHESIFQEQFEFLLLSSEFKHHPNLEIFLTYLNIKVLKQSDFKLIHSQETVCEDLIRHLKLKLPFFKKWIEFESPNEKEISSLGQLERKIETLQIYQSDELKIQYVDIDFVKSVNVHLNKNKLYLTSPWYTNSVLMKLSENLCRYFFLRGHDKKLDFLLRETIIEIKKYFSQEGIDIPAESETSAVNDENAGQTQDVQKQFTSQKFNSFAELEAVINEGKISLEHFHIPRSDYDRLIYAERLIDRAVANVVNYLLNLPEYDCENHFTIAKSIVGGITKNGNAITIVARPSDRNQVFLYYSSEFDVLEYVDAEFWCEDGINPPRQITMGQLLRQTGINRILINRMDVSGPAIATIVGNPKSHVLDFNAVPYVPQKIAMIISSFANNEGGQLIFGIKEISSTLNEVVGLSTDFRATEITKKAISLLSPIPTVTYDYNVVDGKSIFIINTDKSNEVILLDNEKYIRKGARTVLEKQTSTQTSPLNTGEFRKTIAIIIAIENYAPRPVDQVQPVGYATNDAMKFKNVVVNSMNVKEDDIYMLLDDRALKTNLEYEFKGLFHSLEADDRLIFYYVGHGFHNGITNFLTTYDVHLSNISGTAISLQSILIEPLLKSKCKNALIFIDSCAKTFKDERERNFVSDINDEEFRLLSNEYPYYATFLSCQTGQSSYSSATLENGIWTYHLVEALSGRVPSVILGKKYITDRLLQDYLHSSVTKFTMDEVRRDQNPKAILDSSCENVIVTLRG